MYQAGQRTENSNKKQFHFNKEVCEMITVEVDSLDSTPPAVEKAKEASKEGEGLITTRHKVNRIADCSEFGWAMVEEYEEDELEDNPEDYTGLNSQLVGNLKLQQLSFLEIKDSVWIRHN